MIRLPFSRQFFLPLIRQFCKPQVFFIMLFIIIFSFGTNVLIHFAAIFTDAAWPSKLRISFPLRYSAFTTTISTAEVPSVHTHRLFPDSRAYCSCMRIKRTSGNCNMLRPYISAERSDDPVTVLCSCVGIFFYPRVLPDHMQNPSTDT